MYSCNRYQYADLLSRSADLYANTKYEMILDYLEGHNRLNILNAGCGSGELSQLLAGKGHRVCGIDPVPEYIHLARKRAEKIGLSGCSYSVASIEDFQTDERFDCVVATDVLEHIDDDRLAFERMASQVRPGGLIIVTVPAGQWLFGHHDIALGHFRRYSRRTLRHLVEDYCAIDKIRYFGFSLIPICYLYSKLLRVDYPVTEAGDSHKRPFRSLALRCLLRLDRLVPMPLGTSLLMFGKGRRQAPGTRMAA
jgi:SAM-dependent methyltransferase